MLVHAAVPDSAEHMSERRVLARSDFNAVNELRAEAYEKILDRSSRENRLDPQ